MINLKKHFGIKKDKHAKSSVRIKHGDDNEEEGDFFIGGIDRRHALFNKRNKKNRNK